MRVVDAACFSHSQEDILRAIQRVREEMMTWRVARSLLTLRDQVNQACPKRSKSHDGTIGDAAHKSRNSDHNAWIKDGSVGVVSAIDITHDPRNGLDIARLAEHLRSRKDPRIKYVICNKRIFNSDNWQWRSYSGSNPHTSHIHVSVKSEPRHYDDVTPWNLFADPPKADPEAPAAESGPDPRPTLREGARGEEVKILQKLLEVDEDGIFGIRTKAAVKNLQRGADLTPDGIVGPLTWAVLDELEREAEEISEETPF